MMTPLLNVRPCAYEASACQDDQADPLAGLVSRVGVSLRWRFVILAYRALRFIYLDLLPFDLVGLR